MSACVIDLHVCVLERSHSLDSQHISTAQANGVQSGEKFFFSSVYGIQKFVETITWQPTRDPMEVMEETRHIVEPQRMDELHMLLNQHHARRNEDSQMRQRVHEDMSARMDTGIRINPAHAAHWNLSPGPQPQFSPGPFQM